jgi:hypothetical protein
MPDVEAAAATEPSNDVQDLVRRCREGDLHAFTRLFERFQDRLYDLAWAIVYHLQDGALVTSNG